ncbi:unnamed protein product, partial [Protopolystoma xenopodis]
MEKSVRLLRTGPRSPNIETNARFSNDSVGCIEWVKVMVLISATNQLHRVSNHSVAPPPIRHSILHSYGQVSDDIFLPGLGQRRLKLRGRTGLRRTDWLKAGQTLALVHLSQKCRLAGATVPSVSHASHIQSHYPSVGIPLCLPILKLDLMLTYFSIPRPADLSGAHFSVQSSVHSSLHLPKSWCIDSASRRFPSSEKVTNAAFFVKVMTATARAFLHSELERRSGMPLYSVTFECLVLIFGLAPLWPTSFADYPSSGMLCPQGYWASRVNTSGGPYGTDRTYELLYGPTTNEPICRFCPDVGCFIVKTEKRIIKPWYSSPQSTTRKTPGQTRVRTLIQNTTNREEGRKTGLPTDEAGGEQGTGLASGEKKDIHSEAKINNEEVQEEEKEISTTPSFRETEWESQEWEEEEEL